MKQAVEIEIIVQPDGSIQGTASSGIEPGRKRALLLEENCDAGSPAQGVLSAIRSYAAGPLGVACRFDREDIYEDGAED